MSTSTIITQSKAYLDVALSYASSAPGIAQVSTANISLDIVIVVAVVLFVFMYALYRGKKRALSSITALFIAALAVAVFPYWKMLIGTETTAMNEGIVKGLVFAAAFVLARLAVRRMTFGNYPQEGMKRWFEAFVLALAGTGTAVAYAYRFLVLDALYPLSSPLDVVFVSGPALFWWTVGTVTAVYLVVRKYI